MGKIKPGISQRQICEALRLCQAGKKLGITLEEREMLYPTQASRNQKNSCFEGVSPFEFGASTLELDPGNSLKSY